MGAIQNPFDQFDSVKTTHDGLPAVKNPDGSYSTEVSITVTDPRLNSGKPTNIPSLWNGKTVAEDKAVELALNSGKQFQAFDSIDSAVTAAQARSASGGYRKRNPFDQFDHLISAPKTIDQVELQSEPEERSWYSVKPSNLKHIPAVAAESAKQSIRGMNIRAVDKVPETKEGYIRFETDAITGANIDPEADASFLTERVRRDVAKRLEGATDDDIKATKQAALDGLISKYQQGEARIAELSPDDMSMLEEGLSSGVISVAHMAPSMVASFAMRNPAVMISAAGMQTYGNSYGSARSAGLDPSSSNRYAFVDGAIESATELIPGKVLVDAFGSKLAGKAISKKLLEFTIQDMVGEQIATFTQSMNAYAHGLDQELAQATSLEEKAEIQARRQAVTALATVVGASIQSGSVYGLAKAANAVNPNQTENPFDQFGDAEPEQETAIGLPPPELAGGAIPVSPTGPEQIGKAPGNANNGLDGVFPYGQSLINEDADGSFVDTETGAKMIPLSTEGMTDETPNFEATIEEEIARLEQIVKQDQIEQAYAQQAQAQEQAAIVDPVQYEVDKAVSPLPYVVQRIHGKREDLEEKLAKKELAKKPVNTELGNKLRMAIKEKEQAAQPEVVAEPVVTTQAQVAAVPETQTAPTADFSNELVVPTNAASLIPESDAAQPTAPQKTIINPPKPIATQVDPDIAVIEEAAKTSQSLDKLKSYANGRFGREKAKAMSAEIERIWDGRSGKSMTTEEVDLAANEAATSPTNDLTVSEAQKKAGNYKKAHVDIQGLKISIENPKKSERSGVDASGNKWSVTMKHHYGYIKRTEGADGEQVDVFIGPNLDSDKVFVIDQPNKYGNFDEHKVMLGFDDQLQARHGYARNYSKDWEVGPITRMTMDEFKTWLKEGNNKKALQPDAFIRKKPKEEKPKSTYGKNNKIFTEDAAEKARAILKAKLGQTSAGLDPEIIQAGMTLAGYHIEAGARKFTDFAKAMTADLGDAIKPYLRSFYESVRHYPGFDNSGMSDQDEINQYFNEAENVPSADKRVERDSRPRQPKKPVGQESLPDESAGVGEVSGRTSERPEPKPRRRDSSGVPESSAVTAGESGDQSIHQPDRTIRTESSATGSIERSGSGTNRGKRSPSNARRRQETVAVVDAARDRSQQLNTKPATTEIIDADLENIRQTVPQLLPEQQEDVEFAEQRLVLKHGRGVMFTNGTGTGKTFTGLGTIKRYVMRGKRNVLVVVPSDKIATDWVSSAKLLDLDDIHRLDNTKDNGRTGQAITTYANFYQNHSLLERDWDLLVFDESHYLMQSDDFSSTQALKMMRSLTGHPEGQFSYHRLKRLDLYNEIESLNEKISSTLKLMNRDDTMDQAVDSYRAEVTRMEDRVKKLRSRADAFKEQDIQNRVDHWEADKTQALFLSATPFAYRKAIDYAEGFLFDYGDGRGDKDRYNNGNARDQFFVTNFGYRMRYNKLTEPDTNVDVSLMEREFSDRLRQSGAVRSRLLEVEKDYDRKFYLIADAIGEKIDDGIQWLHDRERSLSKQAKDNPDLALLHEGYKSLSHLVSEQFDYLQRAYLLESIKAKHMIPVIKKHLEIGRQVVVFHDYNKGGGFHPFKKDQLLTIDETKPSDKALKMAYRDFSSQRQDLIKLDFSNLPAPIKQFEKAFPDALFFNGTVPKKKRRDNVDAFNNDADNHRLIIVQSDAGREGISMHDTTGRHQRVLINIGLPVKPIASIQIEGRIYRTFVQTDAVQRYVSTGLNMERWAVASKLAERASTAENLAMGSMARGLRESFVNAYEEADIYAPGHKGEGAGGKEIDRSLAKVVTPFERAKTYYYGQQKVTGRRNERAGSDYFATPEPLGLKMVEWAGLKNSEKVLEPSAGHGAILRFMQDNLDVHYVEPSSFLGSQAKMNAPHAQYHEGDFESLHIVNKYHAIVMNPPFGQGGATARDHVQKAMKHLYDGGRIVALVPRGPAADKKFDALLESEASKDFYTVSDIDLPAVAFERAGTSVMARVLVLEKQTKPENVAQLRQQNRDYRSAESINEFFDRIENAEINPRIEIVEQAEAPAPVTGAAFVAMDSKHTQKGHDLFVVNVKGDLGEGYRRVAELAKEHGGFYIKAALRSYYKPKDGGSPDGTPTFNFNSESERSEFLAKLNTSSQPDEFLSTSKVNPEARGMPVEAAKLVVNNFFDKHTGADDGIKVRIVKTQLDLFDGRYKPEEYGRVKGVYRPDENALYIIAANLDGGRDLLRTIQHEILVHKGLGFFPREARNKLIQAVAENAPQSPSLKSIWQDIESDYAGDSDLLRAEELIARLAERDLSKFDRWLNNIVQAIKDFLVRVGLVKKSITRQNLIEEIYRIAEAFQAGKRAGLRDPSETRMSRKTDNEALKKIGLSAKEEKTILKKATDLLDQNWKEAIYEGALDGLIGIRYAEDAVGAGIAADDYVGSGYVGARLATGIADVMSGVLHYAGVEWRDGVPQKKADTMGLMPILQKLDGKINDWLAWMAAGRAAELMEQGRENNLTKEDIQELRAQAKGNEALFEEVRKEYNKLNSAMLDFAEGAGLIDPVARKSWESSWYVPFYRVSDIDTEAVLLGPRTSRGLSHQSSGIKALKGGNLATNDLLENILTNWIKLVDASLKNSALLKTIDNLKGSDFIDDETLKYRKAIVPKSEIIKRVKSDRRYVAMVADMLGIAKADQMEVVHKLAQLDSKGFEKLWSIVAPTDPDVVRVQRNGRNEYYKVNDMLLLRAITHLGSQGHNDILSRTGRWFKRLLTTGVTASPDFILRNFIRDAAHAWAINPDGFNFGTDSIRGLTGAITENESYQAMMFGGASFQGGYVHGTDPEKSAQIARRALRAKGLTKDQIDLHMNTVVNTGKKAYEAMQMSWQKYRELGDKIENANRLATFEAALKAGKPMAQALYESKDLMDYSLRGNHTAMVILTDTVPFLNARLQGMSKLVRAGMVNKRLVAANLAKIAAVSVFLAWLNSDDEDYQALPDWEKDAYWHIFISGHHFRIPKPFEIGIIGGTIPERMYHSWIADTQPNDKVLWSLQHNAMETMGINPIPQAILPVAEVVANRSFYFDTPIESMADEGKLPEARYNEYTSESMKQLGKWTGMSPKQLEHLFEGYTGTMGAYALGATDILMEKAVDAPPRSAPQIEDYPVIKSFYRGKGRERSTQYQTDFYDRMSEVSELYRTFQAYIREGKADQALALWGENQDKLQHKELLEKVNDALGAIRAQRAIIAASEDLSKDEKFEKLQELQTTANKLTKSVSEMTEDAF